MQKDINKSLYEEVEAAINIHNKNGNTVHEDWYKKFGWTWEGFNEERIMRSMENTTSTVSSEYKISPITALPQLLPTSNKRYLLGSYRIDSIDQAGNVTLKRDESHSPPTITIPYEMAHNHFVELDLTSNTSIHNDYDFAVLETAILLRKVHTLEELDKRLAYMNSVNSPSADIEKDPHGKHILDTCWFAGEFWFQPSDGFYVGKRPGLTINQYHSAVEIAALGKSSRMLNVSEVPKAKIDIDDLVCISKSYDRTKFFYEING